MRRAKQLLLGTGIVVAASGGMMLPFAQSNPKALTQSLFPWVAMTGVLVRPGLILILVGLGCLVLSALLPPGRG